MARVLIVYGTTEGHTASIVERMEGVLRDAGHAVEVHDSKQLRKQEMVERFDGVLVGGSVHAGDLQSSVREFVKRNRALLESVPSALFSVSLAAADADDEALADSQAVVDKFVQETGWHPRHVERIAGALVYTQYNLFIRHLMKLIVKRQGRAELDTSQDYDFTDWDGVERFAREFAAGLAPS
jgi:menaquinone-dependent protoporphyrinogen oxidase